MAGLSASSTARAGMAVAALSVAVATAAPLARPADDAGPSGLTGAPITGLWTAIASGDRVSDLLREGSTLWSATDGGGVVRWDLASGGYRQFLAPLDGLPSNEVRSLTRDRAGRLWAATSKGLARFDGATDRWVPVAVADERLPSSSATALAVGPDGALWVGFEQVWRWATDGSPADGGGFAGGGLARYEPDAHSWGPVFRAVPTDRAMSTFATIPSDNVTALAWTAEGVLWIGTRPYFTPPDRRRGGPRGAAAWVRRGGGVAATDGESWRQWLPSGIGEACLADSITDLAADAQGRMWVATAGRGLQVFRRGLATPACRFDSGHSAYVRLRGAAREMSIQGNTVWSVAIGEDGKVYSGVGAGFDEGLGIAVLDHHNTFADPSQPWSGDDTWAVLGLEGRLTGVNAAVSALVVESGELLAGTRELDNAGDGWGVKRRLADGAWSSLSTADDNLASNRITAVAEDPRTGAVWFGTRGSGVAVLSDGRWRRFRAFAPGRVVTSVAHSAAAGTSRVVFSLALTDLARALPDRPRMVQLDGDATTYRIVGAASAPEGVEVQLEPVLALPLRAGAAVHAVQRQLASDSVTSIAFDRAGRAWVAGRRTTWLGQCASFPDCWLDGGVAVFDGTAWAQPEGTESDLPRIDIQALAVDDQGRVWMGTGDVRRGEGQGIVVLDPASGTLTHHDASTGFGHGGAAAIAIDPASGFVWVAAHAAMVCEPDGSGSCIQRLKGGGVARWDGSGWKRWALSLGDPLLAYGDGGDFSAVMPDSARHGVWAGAWSEGPGGFHWNSGVGVQTAVNWCRGTCRDGSWTGFAFAADGPVSDLAVDHLGRLWVSANRFRNGVVPPLAGVRILAGDEWSRLATAQSPLPSDYVTTLTPTSGGMWIGTYDRGLLLWRELTPVDRAHLPLVGR